MVGDLLAVRHEHVDARVRALLDAGLIRQPELEASVEVGDHEAAEAELALEHVGEHRLVDVHLGALPTAVGGHDRPYPRLDRGAEGLEVNRAQLGFVSRRVATGHAFVRAAVAEVVLGVGEDSRDLRRLPRTGSPWSWPRPWCWRAPWFRRRPRRCVPSARRARPRPRARRRSPRRTRALRRR